MMTMKPAILKRIFFFIFVLILICVCIFTWLYRGNSRSYVPVPLPELELKEDDRLLILAPHPDDETLNCAGIIQKAHGMGLPLKIVFLTVGDANEWSFLLYRRQPVITQKGTEGMGALRHEEAINASGVMGVSPDHLLFLGYPDFGTLDIWYAHWKESPPYESLLTRVTSVPYEFATERGAPYKGEQILREIEEILIDFKPTKIFVSHPGDHHPDHQALFLFTSVALWNLQDEMNPRLYSYLTHFKQWPLPKGYYPSYALEPPSLFENEPGWQIYPLDSGEIDIKLDALKRHKTQYEASTDYLLSFIRSNELFQSPTMPSIGQVTPLSGERKDYLKTKPEELTDIEKDAFVGVEDMTLGFEEGSLIITTRLTKPLSEDVSSSVYAFGWRRDVPFPDMPKIHVKVGALTHSFFDQGERLGDEGLSVVRDGNLITIRIPLSVLGNPERILISARTYVLEVPLDWVSWRVLVVPPTHLNR